MPKKHKTHVYGTDAVVQKVPFYPAEFKQRFREGWEEACYRLFKSGKDLSRIIITKGG